MSKRQYKKKTKRKHGIDSIVHEALDHYSVSYDELFTKLREPRIVDAKRAICWIAKRVGYSLPEIGRKLKRHHTTILSHIETAEGYISVDRTYRENFRNLIKKFDLNFN